MNMMNDEINHETFTRVERLSAGQLVTQSNFPLHLVAFIFQAHLPLADGMSQAEWLAREMGENGGVYETGHGCPDGQTIRFSVL